MIIEGLVLFIVWSTMQPDRIMTVTVVGPKGEQNQQLAYGGACELSRNR